MTDWPARLKDAVTMFGHRNWIVVADAAYPEHASPGVETHITGKGLIETLHFVMGELAVVPHIRPRPVLDAEFFRLFEDESPGCVFLRHAVLTALAGRAVERRPHEAILSSLVETAQSFRVLVLKTTERIPYSTVFLPLECGYWTEDQERFLRQRIEETPS